MWSSRVQLGVQHAQLYVQQGGFSCVTYGPAARTTTQSMPCPSPPAAAAILIPTSNGLSTARVRLAHDDPEMPGVKTNVRDRGERGKFQSILSPDKRCSVVQRPRPLLNFQYFKTMLGRGFARTCLTPSRTTNISSTAQASSLGRWMRSCSRQGRSATRSLQKSGGWRVAQAAGGRQSKQQGSGAGHGLHGMSRECAHTLRPCQGQPTGTGTHRTNSMKWHPLIWWRVQT